MTKKFVNAIVPVFHADHVTAVINEALRLGYRLDKTCPTLLFGTFGDISSIHLEPSGKVYAYRSQTAQYLINAGQPREFYRDAVLLTKLRKLRGLDAELNKPEVVTESRDNQASLVVRPKYEVQGSVLGRVRSNTPNLSYSAPYGTGLPICHNVGLILHDVKSCNLSRVYGGKCSMTHEQRTQSKSAQFFDRYGTKDFPKLQKATAEDKRRTVNIESALLSKLIRGAVLVTSKIVSVVKRSFNMLKGGK